jgi:hypothetical protein
MCGFFRYARCVNAEPPDGARKASATSRLSVRNGVLSHAAEDDSDNLHRVDSREQDGQGQPALHVVKDITEWSAAE